MLALSITITRPATAAEVAADAAAQETPTQFDARMRWFREARFGLFIHWGLYSVAAGEWNGKPSAGAGEWIMNDLQIPASQYAKLAPQFNPVKFNARQWVGLAKDAGMKYLVVTSKHHDGFALFPSSHTGWTIKETPFSRDPLKELAQACREAELKFGIYYSIMDWHHPDYAPRKSWNDLASHPPDFERYIAFVKGQLRELLTDYGPVDLLWFDGGWESTWTYERGADLCNYVRNLQPNLILNNRLSSEQPPQPGQRRPGDYQTPEQTIPANGTGPGTDWETCMTMNNTWGFKRSDGDWKSVQVLVRNLVDCASKGGNYLLNVGPMADGLIPEASKQRLKQIGQWMKVNSPAIYGTTASPFKKSLPWGRCTQRASGDSTTLYLHVFDWPPDGELLLPGLRNQGGSAWLLADPRKQPLRAETADNGLIITVPTARPDPISSTVVLTLREAPDIQPAMIAQKRDGSITLPASEARLHGSTLQYESGGLLDNIGWWTTPEDWADWEFRLDQPGRFAISATIAAPANSSFEVSVAGQTLRCTAPETGNYVTFKPFKLGVVKIPMGGKAMLAVRPSKEGWQPMNLKAIRLERIAADD